MATTSSIPEIMEGLVWAGRVTTKISATQFASRDLAGFNDTHFKDWTVYVVHKAANNGAAPQGEYVVCSAYTSQYLNLGGLFTHPAYTVPLEVGDKLYCIHPSIANLTPYILVIIAAISGLHDDLTRPLPSFYDVCQILDPLIWNKTDPPGGTAWAVTHGLGGSGSWFTATSLNGGAAQLETRDYWMAIPALFGVNTVFKKLSAEVELRLTNPTEISGGLVGTWFWGFGKPGDNFSTRLLNPDDIIGFSINGTATGFIAYTNAGVSAAYLATLTNVNKLKIEMTKDHVKFYVNESLIADQNHTAVTNPGKVLISHHTTPLGGLATQIALGQPRIWYDDNPE